MSNTLLTLLAVCVILYGGSAVGHSAPGGAPSAPAAPVEASAPEGDTGTLPGALLDSYYLSPQEEAFSYLQHRSIRRFWDMWFAHDIGGDAQVTWNYETLAPVQLLDHGFQSIAKPDTRLYTCTFTTGDGRCGYLIVSYHPEDPSISKWSLCETTPYSYDLRAISRPLAAALAETDIDLATATAARVEWIDTEKKRGDRIILFTDGKGDRYLCYFGEDDCSVVKQ